MKKSEWVKMGAEVKNVKAAKVRRSSITGKIGKRIKLKGRVTFYKGKAKTKGLRWYSSNKEIAKVEKKTGKLVLKKKGICYVWAKAYNGKNSKKIKVIVN